MSEFDDWNTTEIEDRLFHLEPVDIAEIAFNAGRESLCSQRESYLRGHRAGRAYQLEVDAEIAAGRPYIWSHEVAKAIREQEISDDFRAEAMPDEQAALKIMFEAYLRLKELGFREAIYCPKDGSVFDAIEAGSTGIHTCNYQGEWPNGRWWVHEAGDLWPSRPILFRLKENQND